MMIGILALQVGRVSLGLLATWILKWMIDDITHKMLPSFLVIVVTFGIVNPLSTLVFRWQNIAHNMVGRRLMQQIRDELYRQIIEIPISSILQRPDLLGSLTELFEMEAQISNLAMTYISNSVDIIANFLRLALLLNPVLAHVEVAFIVIAWSIYTYRLKQKEEVTEKKTNDRSAMLDMVAAVTSFEGAAAARLFQMQSQFQAHYTSINKAFTTAGIEEQKALLRMEQTTSIIFSYMRMLVYLIGGIQLIGQALYWGPIHWIMPDPNYALSSLLAVPSLLTSGASSLNMLFGTWKLLIEVVKRLKKLVDFLELRSEEAHGSINIDPREIEGKVEVKDVTFTYKSFQFGPISFTAEPGEVLAIVGPSGAGKSMLIYLLEQFFQPVEGTIQIDGYDVREFSARSFYSTVSAVLQGNTVFAGTIKENLLLARPDASEQELRHALEVACLYNEIMSDPSGDGYNRKLGRGGLGLSGGQIQRLAIARAVPVHPRVLILDEPTSSRDI